MSDTAVETKLPRTPPQILGPFYPFMLTPTEGFDLTNGGQAKGTVLYSIGPRPDREGGAGRGRQDRNLAGKRRRPLSASE